MQRAIFARYLDDEEPERSLVVDQRERSDERTLEQPRGWTVPGAQYPKLGTECVEDGQRIEVVRMQ